MAKLKAVVTAIASLLVRVLPLEALLQALVNGRKFPREQIVAATCEAALREAKRALDPATTARLQREFQRFSTALRVGETYASTLADWLEDGDDYLRGEGVTRAAKLTAGETLLQAWAKRLPTPAAARAALNLGGAPA